MFSAHQKNVFLILQCSLLIRESSLSYQLGGYCKLLNNHFPGKRPLNSNSFCSWLLGNSPIATGGSCGLSSPNKTSIPQNVIWNAKSRWFFIHQRSVLSFNLGIKHYLPLLPRFIAWPRTRLWFNKHLEAG